MKNIPQKANEQSPSNSAASFNDMFFVVLGWNIFLLNEERSPPLGLK